MFGNDLHTPVSEKYTLAAPARGNPRKHSNNPWFAFCGRTDAQGTNQTKEKS
jgi:hypothetical protein